MGPQRGALRAGAERAEANTYPKDVGGAPPPPAQRRDPGTPSAPSVAACSSAVRVSPRQTRWLCRLPWGHGAPDAAGPHAPFAVRLSQHRGVPGPSPTPAELEPPFPTGPAYSGTGILSPLPH